MKKAQTGKNNTRVWGIGVRDVVGQRCCSVRPLETTAECLGQRPAHAELNDHNLYWCQFSCEWKGTSSEERADDLGVVYGRQACMHK
jgi:hypothetical protein